MTGEPCSQSASRIYWHSPRGRRIACVQVALDPDWSSRVAAENAGPGAISVILEAQSLLSGHASSVDVDNDELVTVTITRCPTVNWVD